MESLESIILDTMDTIAIVIKDGTIVYANRFANEFYSDTSIVGEPALGTIVTETESSGRDLGKLIERVEEDPDRYKLNINETANKKGELHWIAWNNSRVSRGEHAGGVLSIGIEATNPVRLRKMLEAIYKNSIDAIISLDSDLNMVHCNPATVKLFRYESREELIESYNDPEIRLRNTSPELIKELKEVLSTKDSVRIEREYLRKDDTTFSADLVLSRIKDYRGNIVNYVALIRDNTEIKEKERELTRLATTDSLTGAYSRKYFEENAKRELKEIERTEKPVAVILGDIDYFKLVNDTYGHNGGDTVLREVANRMQKTLREFDVLARYGGEEFIVLLPNSTTQDAYNVAERIKESISNKPVTYGTEKIGVTMSFGVASTENIPPHYLQLEGLVKDADTKLYISKNEGRNRVTS